MPSRVETAGKFSSAIRWVTSTSWASKCARSLAKSAPDACTGVCLIPAG